MTVDPLFVMSGCLVLAIIALTANVRRLRFAVRQTRVASQGAKELRNLTEHFVEMELKVRAGLLPEGATTLAQAVTAVQMVVRAANRTLAPFRARKVDDRLLTQAVPLYKRMGNLFVQLSEISGAWSNGDIRRRANVRAARAYRAAGDLQTLYFDRNKASLPQSLLAEAGRTYQRSAALFASSGKPHEMLRVWDRCEYCLKMSDEPSSNDFELLKVARFALSHLERSSPDWWTAVGRVYGCVRALSGPRITPGHPLAKLGALSAYYGESFASRDAREDISPFVDELLDWADRFIRERESGSESRNEFGGLARLPNTRA